MTQAATSETPRRPEGSLGLGGRPAGGDAQRAAVLRHRRFRRRRARLPRHAGTCADRKPARPRGLEPRALRLPLRREAPATVNPSLWRQSRLNMHHGLFEVVPGVYQVRGLDIANMTLIEGDTGVIVVDTLTSIEGARAAMELYFKHRGLRPVAAVIFTHTHTDHWGGARGVLEDDAAGERQGADHRAQSVHGARGLRKHHRGAGDAAPRAISVRAVPRQGPARAGRLRPRQVDGGGLGRAAAPDRSHHGNRRQARHRRASNSNSRWRRTPRRRPKCISLCRATSC